MTAYTAPEFKKEAFNCPHCGAFAHMEWIEIKNTTDHLTPNQYQLHTNVRYARIASKSVFGNRPKTLP